jgi:hypothetical protein
VSTKDSSEKAPTASSLHYRTPDPVEDGGYGDSSGKSSPQDYRSSWLRHAYDGFPREVWDGDRSNRWQLIGSREEFLSFLRKQRDNFGPAHTSINIGLGSVLGPLYASPWIDKVLLELDGPGGSPDAAYPEMRRLYSHLKLRLDAEPRVYFSGRRSFHVFVDFSPLPLDNPVEAQRGFAQLLVKGLGLKCLDLQVFAGRKLSRVPHTLNEKTCDFCVPISPLWNLGEIRAESRKPQRFEPIMVCFSERVAFRLREVDAELSSRPKPRPMKSKGVSYGWIESLLKRPLEDGRHRALWHVLAPYLVNVKKLAPDQAEFELRAYFVKCGGVRPLQPSSSSFLGLIRYYVRLAQKDGYGPWRIDTVLKNDPQLYGLVKEVER